MSKKVDEWKKVAFNLSMKIVKLEAKLAEKDADIERLKTRERDYRSTLECVALWTKPYTFDRWNTNDARKAAREALDNETIVQKDHSDYVALDNVAG